MPAIQVRPVNFTDISALVSIDHHYTTEHVWQMDFQEDADQVKITFNERRLPRAMRVEYPRPSQYLAEIWNKKPGILVAELQNGEPAGYINLTDGVIPRTTEITDLAVTMRVRRQGIGKALLLAAEDWAVHHGNFQLIMQLQSKNHPAISLARKLGYEFCGYSDRYYPNQDIVLFFGKSV
ncbi:MAG TPA: GNAT family N-acetyltransferase [Anaerolineales bacterium]|nr:GNAT family N-acetyltransferase [Anaerolineales bacterium]